MNTFLLNGTEFNEGSTLTITAPELGTITVSTLIQSYITRGNVLGLDLGWVQTAHPCKAHGQTSNARLSLYSNGKGYHSLQLAYLCACSHQAHNRSLRWMVRIEGDSIRTESLGTEYLESHNHFIVEAFAYLRPVRVEPVVVPLHPVPLEQTVVIAPSPIAKPKPVLPDPGQKVGNHGQFKMF